MTRRSALLGAAVAVALVLLPRLNSGPRPSPSAQQVAVVGHLSRPPAVAGLLEAAPSTTTTTPPRPPATAASRSAPRPPLPPTTVPPTTVPPPAPAAPQSGAQTAVASWYSLGRGAGACRNYAAVRQACADAYPYTFAHLTMAFGTRVQFCHDGRCVVATCTDRGPYVKGRLFDLSAETAAAIDPAYRSNGILTVAWSAA